MTQKKIKYPIGDQDFRSVREGGFVYVDKTKYIETIIEGSKFYFLARPRRFGKSLFLSTLRYFFEGKRELFKNLYIDTIEWDWSPFPVLRLDLNTQRYDEPGQLDGLLNNYFLKWESEYGVIVDTTNSLSERFQNIIEAAYKKTGKQVVILVDEYDKPLVGNLNKKEIFEHYRAKLASIYSNFKSSSDYIRLVFLTGVSRFSKLSVFSDLNNLNDITFDDSFADMCGITEKELTTYFHQSIELLANKIQITLEETFVRLKKTYDGYRFTIEGSDIYNPWSVLNCLNSRRIAYYWNHTGKPTIIAEALKRINADLEKTFDTYTSLEDLQGLDLLSPNPQALLFQTGYITIKDYNSKIDRIRLGIPNYEVKAGLLKDLLPYYVKSKTGTENEIISDITMHFILGKPEEAMKCMQAYFAGINFKLKMENENNFHNAFFLLMDIIGLETEAESRTSDGSIDITVKTQDYIYVIELKYDATAEKALRQIEEKKYARKFQCDGRQIILIGVNFSSETRCIEDWIVADFN